MNYFCDDFEEKDLAVNYFDHNKPQIIVNLFLLIL